MTTSPGTTPQRRRTWNSSSITIKYSNFNQDKVSFLLRHTLQAILCPIDFQSILNDGFGMGGFGGQWGKKEMNGNMP